MKTSIPYELLNEQMHKRRGLFTLPFVIDHFDQMDIDQPELLAVSRGYGIRDMVSSQAQLGTAITIFYHGKPVAIVGVILFWGGVGEMWALFDHQARKMPSTMVKCALSFIDIAMRYLHLHRLQITVRTDDSRAIRYAKSLYFETECVMRKYGPDKVDSYLMTRL
jgi:hypothetical protein